MEEKELNTTHSHQETESKEYHIRLNKTKEHNISPWPSYKPVANTTLQIKQEYTANHNEEINYTIAGRLTIIRDHGKTFFANLLDRSGSIQLYIKKDIIGDDAFESFKRTIDTGDIIWAEGSLFTTKMGEVTLKVTNFSLLSKCLRPLPEKFHGLSNVEQRYRQRYLDVISNTESREKFKKRSRIIQTIRAFLQQRDFMEVETPMLHPIPGGAAARPFVTHHNAYDIDLYLRIAPELYLKRLVVGGFERVFEINRNFRNEGVSTKHNPEFTMLEFYQAHGDYKVGMETTEHLIQAAVQEALGSNQITFQGKNLDFTAPFKKLTVEESLCEIGGLNPKDITETTIDATIKKHNISIAGTPTYGAKLFALFEEIVEANITQPTFIIGYPIEVSPLAKRDPQNPTIAARFELFAMGMEIANGFTELNDPIDQAQRFKDQVTSREAGDDEAHYYDADYITALEYGLPPTVGVGIGIDRLVMLLTDTNSIKDVILFPTMKQAGSSNPARTVNKDSKPTQFVASPTVLRNFSNPRIGLTIVTGVNNNGTIQQLQPKIAEIAETIRQTYTNETLSKAPHIAAWREAYRTFGSKPSEFPSSIESLYKRILRGQNLTSVNPLVDIYNYISLKYMLPAGGEDLDAMLGDLELTYATNDEKPVTVLGKETPEAPYAGEVIYKDGLGTICRRWNWREVKRTILTQNTTNAILVLEALSPVETNTLHNAQQELAQLIQQHCNASVKQGIVDVNNPSFDFYE